MQRKIIGLIFLVILLVILGWVFNHGVIEVSVASELDNASLEILEQKSQKTLQKSFSGKKISKIVRRGSYEVLVSSGESNRFGVVKVNGWLGKARVSLDSLQKEKARRFVGNNPAPCMNLLENLLISGSCQDSYSKIQLHLPASEDTPTYTKNISTGLDGQVNGFVATAWGNIMLLYPINDNGTKASPSLVLLNNDGSASRIVTVPAENSVDAYYIAPYDEGLVVYSGSLRQILYYASLDKEPVSIKIDGSDNSFQASFLSGKGKSLLLAYSSSSTTDDPHDNPKGEKTKIITYSNGQTAEEIFSKGFSGGTVCGQNKLCLLNGDTLEIYSGKKLLTRLAGVQAFANSPSGLLIVNNSGVLNFDVESGSGYYEYSFGGFYKYCGSLQATGDRYALCLSDSRAQKVALEINQKQENADSIDKKIGELLKLGEIEDISIYDKLIFITPALGEAVFDEASGDFIDDPLALSATKTKIDSEIARLGINRNIYSIINTAE